MGSGNFDVKEYKQQVVEVKASANSGFTAKSMCDEFNPATVGIRYSKKGPFNQFRDVITILIGLDVTGSMDIIPKSLLEGKLGSLMVDLKSQFNRPNENLQISFAGIGDAKTDSAPLQVTHFESDNRFAKQLQKIWLEGCGGGNGAESYNLLWWYAANKTRLNYVKQDKRKGILITIGDDNVHPELTAGEIQAWLDPKYDGGNISNQVLLDAVREQYDVYHVVITDGSAYTYNSLKSKDKSKKQKEDEAKQWGSLLGKNHVIYSKSDIVADAIVEIVRRHRPIERANMEKLPEHEWVLRNKQTLTDEQWQEILGYTLCPLTNKYMIQPVDLGGSKKVYEKQAIEAYLHKKQMDPITHRKLTKPECEDLRPNNNIAQLCLNYKESFNALPEERRERLIQLVRPSQTQVEHKIINEKGKSPTFFSEVEKPVKSSEIDPRDLECPITQERMIDPVILVATGQTYERKAIQQWLLKKGTDPATNVEIADKTIVDNIAMRKILQQVSQLKLNV